MLYINIASIRVLLHVFIITTFLLNLHDSKFGAVKVYFVFDVIICVGGGGHVVVPSLLERRVHHAVDEEAPDETEHDGAGQQEVEDRYLHSSNVKWKH